MNYLDSLNYICEQLNQPLDVAVSPQMHLKRGFICWENIRQEKCKYFRFMYTTLAPPCVITGLILPLLKPKKNSNCFAWKDQVLCIDQLSI